jgi:heptosyltransferase-3
MNVRLGKDAPRRILLVATRRIGDVLLTTPLIRSLRQAWPNAVIDALVFENTQGFLLSNPDLREIITVPARPSLTRHLTLLGRLARRYDLALSTLTSDRAALYAWIAGRRRVGFLDPAAKHAWKRHLLSGWVAFDNRDTHTVLMNLQLASALGIPRDYQVVVGWNRVDEDALASYLPFDPNAERYAVLHPYPKFPYKMWHAAGWAALVHWLCSQEMRCVLTGSAAPDELAYVETIHKQLPASAVNIAGKLTLGQSALLISRARLYVGPDTALTHAAAAVGTPTVALYGPSNPVKWGPWPYGYAQDRNPYRLRGSQQVGNVFLLQGGGDCVPCMEEGCDRHIASFSRCLQDMSAATVIAAARSLLA